MATQIDFNDSIEGLFLDAWIDPRPTPEEALILEQEAIGREATAFTAADALWRDLGALAFDLIADGAMRKGEFADGIRKQELRLLFEAPGEELGALLFGEPDSFEAQRLADQICGAAFKGALASIQEREDSLQPAGGRDSLEATCVEVQAALDTILSARAAVLCEERSHLPPCFLFTKEGKRWLRHDGFNGAIEAAEDAAREWRAQQEAEKTKTLAARAARLAAAMKR